MTSTPGSTARRLKWAAPVAAVAVVAGAATLSSTTASADDRPDLPARTAGQLLSDLQDVSVQGLSGTVVQTSRLGLPELPSTGGEATLTPQSFASGSRTLRVWAAGKDRQRVALLGQLAESDVIRNGRDVWTYTSATREVTHLVLPEPDADRAEPPVPTGALTPQQAAETALAAVDPTTAVTVDTTARVAGRPAYQLVLTPRDTRSLVGRVQIALDSETSLPLRVQVLAADSTAPALEIGFTELSLRTPQDSVFTFTPPKGSTVQEQQLPARPTGAPDGPGDGAAVAASGAQVLGSGWTAVAVFPGGAADSGPAAGPLLDRLSTSVPGGRLISSALLSVLLTDEGTIYVGAVRGEDLQRVAATGAGL